MCAIGPARSRKRSTMSFISTGFAQRRLGIDRCLEFAARREFRNNTRRDVNGDARARVLANTGCPLDRLEVAETNQGYGIALSHRGLNGANQRVEHTTGNSFGNVVFQDDSFDEFSVDSFWSAKWNGWH